MSAHLSIGADDLDCDVIVIGAGLSGLEAANALLRLHLRVVVLEARDRVGGRLYSPEIDLPGGERVVVDAGGAYIGPTQHRVLRLLKDAGLRSYKVYAEGRTVMVPPGKPPVPYEGLIPGGLSPTTLLNVNTLLKESDRLAANINVAAPWLSPHALTLDRMSVEEWMRKHCWTQDSRDIYSTTIRTVLCAEPSEVSMLFWMWFVASGQGRRLISADNGAQERKIVGGSQRLAEQLAQRIPPDTLRLNMPVTHIHQSDHQVLVSCRNGQRFTGRYAIMCLAPPLYSRIQFFPALPPCKRMLSERMPMGCIIKTNMYYHTAFWRDKHYNAQMMDVGGPVIYSYDDCKPEGPPHPSIMGFVLANHYRRWSTMSREERRDAICAQYARAFNSPEALQPLHYFEHDWTLEEWSGGCYTSVLPTNVLTTLGMHIREPHQRIHFGGTETATKWAGYMDGALQSGQRVAHEVLVRLHSDEHPGVPELPEWSEDIPEDPEGESVARPIEPTRVEKMTPSFRCLLCCCVGVLLLMIAAALLVGGWAIN